MHSRTDKPWLRYAENKAKLKQLNEDVTIECKKNGLTVRILRLFVDKDKTIVSETELREDKRTGKFNQYPVHFNVHSKYSYARSEFIGRVATAAMENANPSTDPDNMFVRNMYTDRVVG